MAFVTRSIVSCALAAGTVALLTFFAVPAAMAIPWAAGSAKFSPSRPAS